MKIKLIITIAAFMICLLVAGCSKKDMENEDKPVKDTLVTTNILSEENSEKETTEEPTAVTFAEEFMKKCMNQEANTTRVIGLKQENNLEEGSYKVSFDKVENAITSYQLNVSENVTVSGKIVTEISDIVPVFYNEDAKKYIEIVLNEDFEVELESGIWKVVYISKNMSGTIILTINDNDKIKVNSI